MTAIAGLAAQPRLDVGRPGRAVLGRLVQAGVELLHDLRPAREAGADVGQLLPGVGPGVDVDRREEQGVGRDGLGRLAIGTGGAGAVAAAVVAGTAGGDQRGSEDHDGEDEVDESLQHW